MHKVEEEDKQLVDSSKNVAQTTWLLVEVTGDLVLRRYRVMLPSDDARSDVVRYILKLEQ